MIEGEDYGTEFMRDHRGERIAKLEAEISRLQRENVSLISALSWCLGHMEVAGLPTNHPEAVLARATLRCVTGTGSVKSTEGGAT